MSSRSCVVLALIGLFTLATERSVSACSCPAPGPACQAAWRADAVFAGRVRAIERMDSPEPGLRSAVRVVFEPVRPLLNIPSGPVALVLEELSTCSYRFTVGQEYLVYASKMESGPLTASICSGTKPLSEADADLKYFTALPPAAAGARVYGRINEYRRDPAERQGADYGPVEGVPVTVRGPAVFREVLTDRYGRYELAGLPTGAVTITATPPFGFDTRGMERDIDLENPRGCGEANFTFTPRAQASGVVVDAGGRPLAGVPVEAVAAELAGYRPEAFQTPARTDAAGRFEFDTLPPGTYVFGVNLTRDAAGRNPGLPTFFPGTALAQEAIIIELKAGDRTDIGTLRLQER
jgi:hypothetical protein